jgi:hypothetical protein
VNFSDLLQFQKTPQTLEELHAKAIAYAALNPRLRTEFLNECEDDAKELIASRKQNSNDDLNDTYNICVSEIADLKTQSCTSIFDLQNDCQDTLLEKRTNGLQKQASDKNDALSEFMSATQFPDVLFPLQATNQFDSLTNALLPRPQTSLPFRFRILSRANESYGTNN